MSVKEEIVSLFLKGGQRQFWTRSFAGDPSQVLAELRELQGARLLLPHVTVHTASGLKIWHGPERVYAIAVGRTNNFTALHLPNDPVQEPELSWTLTPLWESELYA